MISNPFDSKIEMDCKEMMAIWHFLIRWHLTAISLACLHIYMFAWFSFLSLRIIRGLKWEPQYLHQYTNNAYNMLYIYKLQWYCSYIGKSYVEAKLYNYNVANMFNFYAWNDVRTLGFWPRIVPTWNWYHHLQALAIITRPMFNPAICKYGLTMAPGYALKSQLMDLQFEHNFGVWCLELMLYIPALRLL